MTSQIVSPPVDADVLCRDGGMVRLRTLAETDAPAIVAFYESLDATALYRRFMTHTLPREEVLLGPLRSGDSRDQMLGAEVAGRLIAIGLSVQLPSDDVAEVAFAVSKANQGRGIGTLLLEHLAATARDRGRTRFVARTMSSNLAMLDVFEQAGFRITEDDDRGDVFITLELDDQAGTATARRDSRSHAASVARVLRPSTVAVVGASRTQGTVGHALFRNLLTSGFAGTIYPVNLRAPSVLGVAAYESVEALPVVPDLVVIAVPAPAVKQVLTACGQRGVAAAVIVTAGFAESAPDGEATERELVEIARFYGMRIVGPNCVGIVNTDPDIGLNATFSPATPTRGPVGFASQSGALGIAALDRFDEADLGISSFVSLGNKADVSSNDLLQYWRTDPETSVAALYLESFGNPRKFGLIARNFCLTKPIVAVKSGRTVSGRRAASSHTAALASSDLIAESLFRDAGIIRVDTLAELFEVTRMLATQPVPRGTRVAIVGNSGGPGILAADACEGAGLDVPALSQDTQAALRTVLLPGAGVSNPVDLIAAASAEQYEQALTIVLADDEVDAVIVIYTDPMVSEATDVARAISNAAAGSTKPIVANFLAADVGATIAAEDHAPIPVYEFPESAARSVGHAAQLGVWRQHQYPPNHAELDVDVSAARQLIANASDGDGAGWLKPRDVDALLAIWGLGSLATTTAVSASEAAAAAERIGLPVALKLTSDTITHKTDVGGVVLDLESAAEVAAAFDDMAQRLGTDMTGAVVQAMANPGTELIVGGLSDQVFGPVVVFGAGGTAAEVWQDRAVALAPVSRERATALIGETKVATLLTGHRGAEAADLGSLADIVTRVAALMAAHPEVAELDLNPVIASSAGVQIVDARCRVTTAAPTVTPRRHLD